MHIMDLFLIMSIGVAGVMVAVWIDFSGFEFIMRISKKKPRGYHAYKKLISSEEYKRHESKWLKIYLILCFFYMGCMMVMAKFMNGGLAVIISYIILAICTGCAGNLEVKERRNIEKKMSEKEIESFKAK